jgi:GMP synthase (glutamine-hydrolysing)
VARRIVVIEHEPDCTLDRFADWLGGVSVHVVRPYAGEPVPASVEHGLIVLGGDMSAYDDAAAPWLPAVRDLLAASVAGGVPTLGICLGAQLLAVACGGKVEVRAAPGRESGVIDVRWRRSASEDALMGGLPDPLASPSLHADAIVRLPPGAVWLATSAMYPHQAFRAGAAAWGVQFHPEVSPAALVAWAEALPDVDAAEVTRQLTARGDEVIEGGRALARRFGSLVRDGFSGPP